MSREGLAVELVQAKVTDATAAQVMRFPSSPTVRVDCVDIHPAARTLTEYGFICRTYVEDGNPWSAPRWNRFARP